ncbi:N-acetylmuramoyl-L-alanine amidase [Romboutsia sp.]|uniref:N-acetylmuramoyl-L-alanine amidase n=1 Tax=Romboutsia sp. TaxID=1965302 RepID=UPI002CB43CB8|nr:N-acetylmuramoyl-L-alanine amidase [Romboutsia sp.]HSQ89581.1 N-acetylmuramoyl-L-alanine amidase [Romboutsia sp.]
MASTANKESCDYFVSLHMNSSTNKSAKECEVWVYDEKSKLYILSKSICSNLSKTINTPNRGVKISKDFSVLRKTKMSALLIEIDFISHSDVEASCKSSKYIKDIAGSISSTLLSFVNKSIADDGVFYRVCIGTFKDKSNTVKLKNEAISKCFKDTYIVTN